MSKIFKENIKKVIEDKYLSYAVSTIISRSLPDVRDGLKPVHRRIIYSMYELNSRPDSAYKKSARIVGDVMGKFHPHGDQAIYDSLVRMSQDFSIRYPLIDGQGNFGNIDGDNPAAMRYTEARLHQNSINLLEGLEENAVDYIDNYDGQNTEPSVLPALFPNILLNGASGIAVGMATNIPSHNIHEVCDAMIDLIKNPNVTNKKLLKFIKGPDLPTGGEVLIDEENFLNIYNKGKGSFVIKSKWNKINLSKGQYLIAITEIPYQINKNRIIENIAKLIKEKKIPIDDIWDESDKNIRIIIKPRNRNIEADKLIEVLFKYTDLSTKYHCNFNVLLDGKIPKLIGLKEILTNFLSHRRITVKRISEYKINKIQLRIEILLGFIIVYKNLDKIIKIIRNSTDPKKELMKKFRLKSTQAISILDMKLRSLRKIEEKDVKVELVKLKKELFNLKKLVKNKLVENNNKYFFLADKKLNDTYVNKNKFIKKFQDLFNNLSKELKLKDFRKQKIYKVLRVITGNRNEKESHRYHFDAHLFTVLIPIIIPNKKKSNNGDLIIFPNIRKITKSIIINILQKILYQNRITKFFLKKKFILKRKSYILKLKPGNMYIFYGFRTLHGNQSIDSSAVRATLLLHFYDVFDNSKLVKINRKNRLKIEQKIINKNKV